MAFGSDYGNSTFNQKQRKQLHEQFNIMGSNDNLLRMQITYGSSVFDTYSVPKLSKLVMKSIAKIFAEIPRISEFKARESCSFEHRVSIKSL